MMNPLEEKIEKLKEESGLCTEALLLVILALEAQRQKRLPDIAVLQGTPTLLEGHE